MVFCKFPLSRDELGINGWCHRYFTNSKYLSDPTEDVRVATENLMADFLREIREIAIFARRREEKARANREIKSLEPKEPKGYDDRLPDITVVLPERGAFLTDHDGRSSALDTESAQQNQSARDDRDNGCMCKKT